VKALVINLDRAVDRLDLQRRQLEALGVEWDRIPAVTPAALTPPANDPYWRRWQRPLRDTEKALALSHRAAWDRVAAGEGPVLILEDDAILSGRIGGFLSALDGTLDLGRVSLETRGRRKLLSTAHPSLPLRELVQDYSGSAAYVIWPGGAHHLLRRMDRSAALSDAMLNECRTMPAWQAVPALAVQADIAARYGVTPPIPVQSSIGTTHDRPSLDGLPLADRLGFRSRRIGAQLGQAVRRARHIGRAQREEVPFLP
jgi:glycosyl transferase family 25